MKNKSLYAALIVLGLILAVYFYPLSFIPQSDISFSIARVSVQGDSGTVWGAYPDSVSWSHSRDHDNLMPGVSIAATLNGVKALKNYTLTFGGDKYAIYAYAIYIQVQVKASGGDPTGPKNRQGSHRFNLA